MQDLVRQEQETIFESCVYLIEHSSVFGVLKAVFNLGTLIAAVAFAVSFYSVTCILEVL